MSSLFRREAIAQRFKPRASTPFLELDTGWTRWILPIVALLLLGGLAWMAYGSVRRFATGQALIQLDKEGLPFVLAIFPEQHRQRIRRGDSLSVAVAGQHEFQESRVETVENLTIADAAELREFAVAGIGRIEVPALLVRAHIPQRADIHNGTLARARICIGFEPLLSRLFPRFKLKWLARGG